MMINCTYHFQHPDRPEPIMPFHKDPVFWGVMGAYGITIAFYLVQSLGMQSWTAPISFMFEKWYFVLPLVIGFGVQVGLFSAMRLKAKKAGAALVASGGVSTSTMAACCLHNFAALLPVVGLTGTATFFTKYQSEVFLASIGFMILGVVYMWRKHHSLHACCDKNEVM